MSTNLISPSEFLDDIENFVSGMPGISIRNKIVFDRPAKFLVTFGHMDLCLNAFTISVNIPKEFGIVKIAYPDFRMTACIFNIHNPEKYIEPFKNMVDIHKELVNIFGKFQISGENTKEEG